MSQQNVHKAKPAEAINSYNGFQQGSYAARKGRQCQIKKIHFEMYPPAVTVFMFDNETEVGTEFDRLEHIKSWFCSMCTAENANTSHKCQFCLLNRTYKEKVTTQKEPVVCEEKVESAPDLGDQKDSNDKANEEIEENVSEETEETPVSPQSEESPQEEEQNPEEIDDSDHEHSEPEDEIEDADDEDIDMDPYKGYLPRPARPPYVGPYFGPRRHPFRGWFGDQWM